MKPWHIAFEQLLKALRKEYSTLLAMNKNLEKIRQSLQSLNLKMLVTPTKEYETLARQLPSHLAKTYFSLLPLERATASQVASKTGKARAVESLYLNTLHKLGYVEKERDRRVVVFFIKP